MDVEPFRKIYLDEDEDFSSTQSFGRRVETQVRYSTDARDMGWVRENVPCQAACPAGTNIPAYIRMITEQRYSRSYELNRIANVLPGVLGRICSRPCEDVCRHGWPGNGEPVAICHLKRFVADAKPSGHRINESLFTPTGKRIAVLGAGPAGIAASYDLTTLGHDVTLFEREQKAGGMLAYGIPEFRLPRDILDEELRNAIRLGVDLKTGVEIGNEPGQVPLQDMVDGFDAVLMATGCMAATQLPLPAQEQAGDDDDLARNIPGVEYGLDFLMDLHRGVKKSVGKTVAVVGAGFTALDCARVAKRLGATDVTIHIRTAEEYIPVGKEEIFESKREAVKIKGLRSPVALLTGEQGELTGIRFVMNRLGGWRAGGRRKPIAIEGSEFDVKCDTLLIAIGQKTVNDYLDPSQQFDRWGNIRVSKESMTSIDGLFAAGDFVTGQTTVVDAVGAGRRAALSLDTWLMGRQRRKQVVKIEAVEEPLRERSFDFIQRQEIPTANLEKRFDGMTVEVEHSLEEEKAYEEAKRCYLCYLRYEIDVDNCIYCRACIEVAPRDCIKLVEGVEIKEDGTYGKLLEVKTWDKVGAIWIDNNECIRCGACYTICPTQCISIVRAEMFLKDI